MLKHANATNFVGCDNELRRVEIEEMDEAKLGAFLLQNGGEWMGWMKNPPIKSHGRRLGVTHQVSPFYLFVFTK